MSKRRILFIGEASYLATGFSTYWNEVISRIHKTGRFEVAEFGSYGSDVDPRNHLVPWKFYPNAPDPNDQAANQAYHSRQANQFGEWRFNDVLLDWKPDCVCVPPGTSVETPCGPRNIEDIRTGDYVISHTGVPRRVTKTMRRQHTGSITNVYIFGDNRTYRFTDEHPVLVVRSKKRTWKERDVRQRHFVGDAEFVPASELCANDYVVIPIYTGEEVGPIDVRDHLTQFIERDNRVWPVGRDVSHTLSLPIKLEITPNFARLLGYYCAEGSGHCGGIQLSFDFYEREFVEDVLSLGKELFGLTGTVVATSDKGTRCIRFNSVLLDRFMESLCKRGSHNKIVPDCIYRNNNRDVIEGFLAGFVRGDGTYKQDTVSMCTVSKVMAHQLRQICLRLGIKTSIRVRKSQGNKLVPGIGSLYYEIEAYGGHARRMHVFVRKHEELPSRHPDDPKHLDKAGKGWIDQNYLLVPVRRVRSGNYDGQVYNLEVEKDNSYVTGFGVHNCQIRDWWMDEFVLRSPLRKNFKVVWMPTVDGEPQRNLWVDTYKQCDALLTYSRWGKNLLENEYGLKVTAVASPGADIELFKPVPNKAEHKSKHGIDPSTFIIGTVMRNQKRKLYMDLIEAFAQWLYSSKRNAHMDIAKKTYLYLHTSYPDVGYDIGAAIKRFKVGNKVLMTYLCSNCGTAYPSFFAGEWTYCRRCGKLAAHPPNANHSVGRDVLASIYNLFDVYVQYSISEGWGMPVTEAMSCGVPAMAVNYSAMEDHVKMPGGIPINVERYFYEAVIETEQRRALPDNKHFAEQLNRIIRMKPEQRQELARTTREYIVEPASVCGQSDKLPRFGYERTAAIWMNLLETIPIHDRSKTWDRKELDLKKPNLKFPEKIMTNTEFVRWVIENVMCRPDLAISFMANEWGKWLNCGFKIEGNQRVPCDRNTIVNMALQIINEYNNAEHRRMRTLMPNDSNGLNLAVL